MQLTSKVVAKYIGGQMKIQNDQNNYLYQGEIQTITVDQNNKLKIRFTWLARMVGGAVRPSGRWVKDDNLDYAASLELYSVLNISDGRIVLNSSSILGEFAILFPPNGSKLDPVKVEGLQTLTSPWQTAS